MTLALFLVLGVLLVSLGLNGFQWYRWSSYRTKPAGQHSHTGMIPVIKPDAVD